MMRIYFKFNFLIVFIFCTSNVLAQKDVYQYKKIENSNLKFIDKDFGAIEVEEYLPINYVQDASKDYTKYVQKAIDSNNDIIFPNYPILINDEGLHLKSNSRIYFREKSSLILKPTAKEQYNMFVLNNLDSVIIYNPTLIGDRNEHKGTKGEWGMGIRINGSRNIKIYNVSIKDMWGDGIYISSSYKGLSKTKDILIHGGAIDNTRRVGVTIIGGENIHIKNLFISNINGTHPASGVVVEPNRKTDFLTNILLENITTFNNQNDGIVFNASKLLNNNTSPEVSVDITNHKDISSRWAMRFSKINTNSNHKKITGYVKIKNAEWIDTRREEVMMMYEDSKLPQIIFKNVGVNKNEKRFIRQLNKYRRFHKQFYF